MLTKGLSRGLAVQATCLRPQLLLCSEKQLTERDQGVRWCCNKEKGEGGSEEKAPIRWMAPESIENDIYTESNDVWSFGVTVWEIFTCGRIPFTGIPAMGLLKELQRGQRLERPNNEACSVEIYEIMMLCLSLEPRVRPKFVVRLSCLLQRDSGYPQLSDHFRCWKQSRPRQFTVTFVPTL
ncbi:Tyrosine kinase receptor Cad96Ca [Geodia barretti]|uniref:Tyrosine kinase receptor Cad96Ca n=1 Tax=Geodia barretti TaxID=519541 RepID=A0AA35TB35_GEOBA|nr:Tyrosine kinase receptor Cad96Ca [Geodia barretti]